MFFDDVRVPRSHLLGETEGQGFIQLMTQLPQERLIVAVGAVAAMELAVEQNLKYTREREAFGRPVFGFQNTKFILAEAATETRIARVFLDYCIDLHLAGQLDVQTVAMAKWWTTERAMKVLDDCLQLHGGYGYMTEYPISRLWVDQRVQKIYAGTNEVMKEIIVAFPMTLNDLPPAHYSPVRVMASTVVPYRHEMGGHCGSGALRELIPDALSSGNILQAMSSLVLLLGWRRGVVDLAGDVRLMQRMISFLVLPSARR